MPRADECFRIESQSVLPDDELGLSDMIRERDEGGGESLVLKMANDDNERDDGRAGGESDCLISGDAAAVSAEDEAGWVSGLLLSFAHES